MGETKMSYENPVLKTSYDFISILDGLSDAERKKSCISQKLNDLFTKKSFATRLKNLDSGQDFTKELNELLQLAQTGKRYLIHIVAHGNENGILFGPKSIDANFIAWASILSQLQEIHENTCGSLILNMSTCKGLYGARMVPYNGKYPFFGIIGAKVSLSSIDAIKANEIMYTKWLTGTPIEKIVPETNNELGKPIIFNLSAEGYRRLTLLNIKQ